MDFYILRVFVNENNDFGNPLGVVVDENQKLSPNYRQEITIKSGISECVFINKISTGDISIYNPQTEVSFAGHALIGASFFLHKELKIPMSKITCQEASYSTGEENGKVWIKAQLYNLPPWYKKEVESATIVESYSESEAANLQHTIVWSWIDKEKGIIRARTFAPDWGIPEDEANGSGTMELSIITNNAIKVVHGKGSVIFAQPVNDNLIKLSGSVIKESIRPVTLY